MPDPVSIRRLSVDDWQAGRAIRLQALAECPGNYFTSLAEAEARDDDDWRAMLANPRMATFGLFVGNLLAGLTAIYIADEDPSNRTAGFAMSYLRPEWRGRGFARRLHEVRLDWARANNMVRVIVSHRASNAASRAAILRSGFRRIRAEPYLWPDGVTEDDVRYELML
jgi:RimJ/RimL family protein N-acetyltransferase